MEAELTLNLLGPFNLRVNNQSVTVSSKAATLLSYLALDQKPLHREAGARLLWTENGLQNLRVELSVLRRSGINLSPNRSPLLTLPLNTFTDVAAWFSAPADMQAREHLLRSLRGEPMSDLKGHGISETQRWLDGQRNSLNQYLQDTLRHWHNDALLSGNHSQVKTIEDTLRQLGWSLPKTLDDQPFAWLAQAAQQEFGRALARAETRPHLLLYAGRHASGRRTTLQHLSEATGRLTLNVDAQKDPRVFVSSLAFQLINVLPKPFRPEALDILHHPTSLEQDLVRVGLLLTKCDKPIILTVYRAETGSRTLAGLLDFVMGLPLPLLIIVVTATQCLDTVKHFLSHHLHPDHLSVMSAPGLTPRALRSAAPHLSISQATEIVRQSEGWWPGAKQFLDSGSPPLLQNASRPRARLSLPLVSLLRAEVSTVLPSPTRPLALLASLPAPFSEATAHEALRDHTETQSPQKLLHMALKGHLLERVPGEVTLHLPNWSVHIPDDLHPLRFVSELQRAALAATLDSSERIQMRQYAPVMQRVQEKIHPIRCFPAPHDDFSSPNPAEELLFNGPGGYQVIQSPDHLIILHLGATRHDVPVLRLQWSDADPDNDTRQWQWTVTFRIEQFSGLPHHYPLRLEAAGQVWEPQDASGEWMVAQGVCQAPSLTLKTQAADLILHVRDVTFTELSPSSAHDRGRVQHDSESSTQVRCHGAKFMPHHLNPTIDEIRQLQVTRSV